jgi:hypothetical protein
MKKKRPFSEFSEIAAKGELELTFCEMFRANGEPNWPRMDLFLNGDKTGKRISFYDAITKRIDHNRNVQDSIPWSGVSEGQKKGYLKRIGNALSKGKSPKPNQMLKAACWLFDAHLATGGDIPNGARKDQTNLRRLKIENPRRPEIDQTQAHLDSGLSDEALRHAKDFCDEFEELKIEDARWNVPE